MKTYPRPSQKEASLVGRWVVSGGKIVADDVCRRIEYLINDALVRVAADPTGWFTLYEDLVDGRYWELSYPQSEQTGGGAPRLEVLEREEAARKYSLPR